MIAELRQKSQITIPKSIVSSLSLSAGDKLEVYEKDGVIYMVPVAVYPKAYVEELEKEVAAVRAKLQDGTQPVFDNADDMFASLEEG